MPFASLPGALISRGLEAPQHSTTRSYSFKQLCRLDIHTDIALVTNVMPSSFIIFDLPVNDLLFQLHIRNTVHEQSADPVMTFKYRYQMPSLIQLVCSSKSGRTAADDRYLLTGSHFRRLCVPA